MGATRELGHETDSVIVYRVRHPFLRFLAQKFSTKISYRMFGGHQLIESWFLLEKKVELLV